jgi:hypothetical protein
VRWIIPLFILSLVYGATAKRECSVSDFVNIGYSNHDPKERFEKAWNWLEESGPVCTKEQLTLIYANLPTIMGSVDSMKIRSRIEQLYERASK